MTVDSPRLLWALLAVPVVFALGARAAARAARFARACSPAASGDVAARRALALGLAIAAAESVVAASVIIGLAGLSIGRRPVPEGGGSLEVAMVVDVSNSMLAADSEPTRLERAVMTARSLLASRPRLTWSLVAARGGATVLVPPTDDVAAVDEALGFASTDAVTLPGTNLGAGVRAALRSGGAGSRIVLVFSDGDDRSTDLGRVSAEARAFGAVIVAVAFGGASPVEVADAEGRPVLSSDGSRASSARNEGTLARLAAGSGGALFDGDDPASLAGILEIVDAATSGAAGAGARTAPADRSGAFAFVAALALFARALLSRLRSRGDFA
ncbi:MAG: VWA domain-containing protein [Spirochaetales bacterium]|nr:VWA domain-containing protein [Spirochaetales bacterium]